MQVTGLLDQGLCARAIERIDQVEPAAWNELAGAEQPFLRHARGLATQRGSVERTVDGIEPGDEARHVGALLLGRKGDVERPVGDGRDDGAFDPQLDRIAHAAHADALDRQMAIVARRLRVGDVQGVDQVGHRASSGPFRQGVLKHASNPPAVPA